MSYQQTQVPHLSSTMGVYSTQHDRSKPTLFLMPSFGMAFQIFDSQYNDQALLDKMNLVCVEPLGQGGSKAGVEHVRFHLTRYPARLCLLRGGVDAQDSRRVSLCLSSVLTPSSCF